MKIKSILAALALALAGVGSYWYFSPYLTLKSMKAAAQANDADAFNDKVDYPRVRESLKGQMSAMMAEKLGSQGNGSAALGAMLGMALVNQMVDTLVRPELVMRSMQEGKFKPAPTTGKETSSGGQVDKKVEWTLDRRSTNKVIAYAQEPGQMESKDFGLVFERSGFADWKLTEVRIGKLK